MIGKLQKRLNLSDQEVAEIKKEQADVAFNKKIAIFIVVVLFISFFAQIIFKGPIIIIGIVIAVILSLIGLFLYNKESNEFSDIVKDIIIHGLFKEAFTEVVYQPDKGLDKSFIDSTGLYPKGNLYSSDDLLSANYKDIGFIQADVSIKQVTSTGKTTTVVTLFDGRWFICDFIKDFNGYHQIRTNRFFRNTKPFWTSNKAKRFQFESENFNQKFTAYTNDEGEAFYLINPGYMQRIENFVDQLNHEVVFGFIDNKLHVAIFNNEDAFELKKHSIDEGFVDSIESDIELIKIIIDQLDLQLDIFK